VQNCRVSRYHFDSIDSRCIKRFYITPLSHILLLIRSVINLFLEVTYLIVCFLLLARYSFHSVCLITVPTWNFFWRENKLNVKIFEIRFNIFGRRHRDKRTISWSWISILRNSLDRFSAKSTNCFHFKSFDLYSFTTWHLFLSRFSLFVLRISLRKTRTHPDWSAWRLSRASRSSAKQSDAAFTDPSIWQSRLSRERPACSPSLSLSPFSSSSIRAVVTAKRFNLTLTVSLWHYWLSGLTPRNRVANECGEVNYSRFETCFSLSLSLSLSFSFSLSWNNTGRNRLRDKES